MAWIGGETVLVNYRLIERLRFIDAMFDCYGEIKREFIADYFGISIVQVSLDIKAYKEFAEGNFYYCDSKRRFVKSPLFERKWP